MKCPNTEGCPLFPLFAMESLLSIWKMRFCDVDRHVECQRFQRSKRGEPVPKNMLPDGNHLPVSFSEE